MINNEQNINGIKVGVILGVNLAGKIQILMNSFLLIIRKLKKLIINDNFGMLSLFKTPSGFYNALVC